MFLINCLEVVSPVLVIHCAAAAHRSGDVDRVACEKAVETTVSLTLDSHPAVAETPVGVITLK